MPDEKPVESNPETPSGGQESSTPAPSGGSGQSLPVDIGTVLNRLTEVEKLVKGVQKGTDKRIAAMGDSIERVLELAQSGMTREQIERELVIDEIMRERKQADPNPVPDKDGKGISPDLSRIVDEALQLPEDDPRVTDLKAKYGNDPKEYLRKGLELAASLERSQDESTPAEQPIPTGGGAPKQDENPIKDIDDPKTLYRLAAQRIKVKKGG